MAQINEAQGLPPTGLRSKEVRATPSTPSLTSKQARRAGTYRYEEGGRYLYRYGPNGATVFDLAKLGGWTPDEGVGHEEEEGTKEVAAAPKVRAVPV